MIFHTKTTQLSEDEIFTISKIYKEVFSAPPRKEIIDLEEFKSTLLSSNHFISILFIENKIKGFAVSTNLDFFKDKDILVQIENNAAYFSEFAIDEEIRGQGFGKLLLNAHLSYLKSSFSFVYTRSRIDIESLVKMYLKHDFKIIQEYVTVTNQEVSKKHIYIKKL